MTKVYCADITCKYCKNSICTRKTINLSQNSVITVTEGRQLYNRCRDREESKEFTDMKLKLYELLVKERDTNEDGKRSN